MPSDPSSLTRREVFAFLAAPLTITGHRWTVAGRPTYPGAPAEGLLLNVRMVNAVFEDVRRPGIDPAANTARFLAAIPDYLDHGIRAFTLSLQGGDPGYEGALNSAILPDGRLKPAYLARVAKVIDACDRLGAAVILSIFYQRQDQVLRDERAVRAAVRNVARWARHRRNVMLEIANEYAHRGYDHAILRSPAGQAELIALARENAPGRLISTSGLGDARIPRELAAACDYLTPHLNNTAIEDVPGRLAGLRQYGKPIVVNEDDKTGALGARSARVCISAGVSWGYMASQVNQRYPFRFDGANDDPPVYALLKHLTTADDYFPPPDAAGGWRTRLDPRFDAAFDEVRRSTRNGGLVIVRDGWLVYERYFGLGHRDATPNLASLGKSFTSAACGILLAERLDAKVFTPELLPPEAFPLSDPRLAEVRLGQLLCMTAGLRGNNPVYVNGKPQTIDPPGPDGAAACLDSVALRPSMWCAPGEGYSYATASAHLASIVVRQVSGIELQPFLAGRLARPLGWGEWGWGYRNTPAAVHTPGGGGIALRAADMLRFGWLLANDGRWADTQVIPRDYVRHCRRPSPYNPHSPYSLQFDVATDGTDAFWKLGSGGHALGVVPSKRLVVWKLGGRDGQYSPADTGLKPSPGTGAPSTPDPNLDAATAWRRTLAAVLRLCAMLLFLVRFGSAAVDTAIGDDYFDGRDPVSRVERHLKMARKLGVQYLRCAFSWNGIEPEQGRYEWRFWDALVAGAAKHKIGLIPYVAYTPKWAARSGEDFYRQPPRDPQLYADFLYAAASRYRGRVRSWEIWNEPDNKDYWTGSVDEFATLVALAARRIRDADPAATVVLGGMANGPSDFFRALIATHHADRNVDVVAIHAYPESWLNERAETIFDDWIPTMRRMVDPKVGLWLNEMGYADYRLNPGEASIYGTRVFYRSEHTSDYQAAMLFKMHVMALATGQVARTGWYRIDDFPHSDTRIGTDLVNHHLGVVDTKGRPKPAFRALRFFTRRFRTALPSSSTAPGQAVVKTFLTPDRRRGVVVAWLRSSRPGEISDRSGMLEDTRSETLAIDPPCAPGGKLKAYDPQGRKARVQPLDAVRLTGPDVYIAEFSCLTSGAPREIIKWLYNQRVYDKERTTRRHLRRARRPHPPRDPRPPCVGRGDCLRARRTLLDVSAGHLQAPAGARARRPRRERTRRPAAASPARRQTVGGSQRLAGALPRVLGRQLRAPRHSARGDKETTMKNTGTLQVRTGTDTQVLMTRVFDAPRQLVWDAFAKPELLRQWFGPRGWTLPVCEVDHRVGGGFRFVMQSPDGKQMGMRGSYRELVEPERSVHAESFDDYPGESIVTAVFTERDGKTTLDVTVEYPSQMVRDIVLQSGMEHGAAESYDKLAELLPAAA